MREVQKSAFIAIVGRPNVGKSSLLNALLGEKVAIVSPRPQTTRTRITGVLTEGATQLVFIDTPGLHRARNSLGEYMVRQVGSSVSDVDLAVLVTDASEPWEKLTRAEMDLIEQFKKLDLPAVAVLNKIDLLKDKEQLIPMMAVLNEAYDFQQIVPLSAKTGDGVALLRKLLHEAAIEGPHYFDDDMLTDLVIEEAKSTSTAGGIVDYLSHHLVDIIKEEFVSYTNLTGWFYEYIPESHLLIQLSEQEHLNLGIGLLLGTIKTGWENLGIVEDESIALFEVIHDILELQEYWIAIGINHILAVFIFLVHLDGF